MLTMIFKNQPSDGSGPDDTRCLLDDGPDSRLSAVGRPSDGCQPSDECLLLWTNVANGRPISESLMINISGRPLSICPQKYQYLPRNKKSFPKKKAMEKK